VIKLGLIFVALISSIIGVSMGVYHNFQTSEKAKFDVVVESFNRVAAPRGREIQELLEYRKRTESVGYNKYETNTIYYLNNKKRVTYDVSYYLYKSSSHPNGHVVITKIIKGSGGGIDTYSYTQSEDPLENSLLYIYNINKSLKVSYLDGKTHEVVEITSRTPSAKYALRTAEVMIITSRRTGSKHLTPDQIYKTAKQLRNK
jgi:hypothetical protein